jgi:putative methyltransferase
MSLVVKTLQHSHTIDKLFDHTGILKKEANMNETLASIMITELVWGKKVLQGESKPVQALLKYEDEIFIALKAPDVGEEENTDKKSWLLFIFLN